MAPKILKESRRACPSASRVVRRLVNHTRTREARSHHGRSGRSSAAAGVRRAVHQLLDAGRRDDAMELFMKTVGLPEETIAGMLNAPMWPGMEAIGPPLAYDATIMGEKHGAPPVWCATSKHRRHARRQRHRGLGSQLGASAHRRTSERTAPHPQRPDPQRGMGRPRPRVEGVLHRLNDASQVVAKPLPLARPGR
jgi:hypothetical protein